MDTGPLRASLASFPAALRAACADLDDERARVRPPGGGWSVVEVARHLLDEERRDFRPRIEATLAGAKEWEPIDPEGWASGGAYLGASLAETLDAFQSERGAALAWLDALASPDWNATYAHPELGELTAGDLYASWAAHDALHLAQLARVRAHVLAASAAPHGIRYATG